MFCSDNTLYPPLFPSLVAQKTTRIFFSNGVLNLVLGYRIFSVAALPFFFSALFGEFFPSVLSLLYSRTLRLSCRTLIEPHLSHSLCSTPNAHIM